MEILDLSKMTIREIESKIKHYELQLDYYLGLKEKMFNATQPKSVDITKEMVQGGKKSNVMLEYVIAIEDVDRYIDDIQDEMTRLTKYVDGELKIMKQYEPIIAVIVELKEVRGLSDEEIGQEIGYCTRHIRRLYKEHTQKRCP